MITNMLVSSYGMEHQIPTRAVESFALGLPDGLLARYLRLTDMMLEFGANLGMPHTRAMSDGLFELRVKK